MIQHGFLQCSLLLVLACCCCHHHHIIVAAAFCKVMRMRERRGEWVLVLRSLATWHCVGIASGRRTGGEGEGDEVTKQAIQWRTALPILARGVEWGNACHYPLKGHRQGKEMMKGKGWVYLAWDTHHTGLQGKDQENLTGVLWQWLWPLYTTTVFVHVYTRSPIREKRDYCYWSSTAVSETTNKKIWRAHVWTPVKFSWSFPCKPVWRVPQAR